MEQDVTSVNPVTGLAMFVIWLALVCLMVWPYVRIIQKAGYSGWNILWMLVPIANIIMLFVFAFSRWPIEEKVERLESKVF